jgi:hypothetical protein
LTIVQHDRIVKVVTRRPLLVLLLAATTIGLGSPAAAGSATALSLHGVSKMVSDTAHDQTFVTGSGSDSSIVVIDGQGTVTKTITGEGGAGGMALDGSTLYVALCGSATIDVIDTATLEKTDSFAAPGLATVCDLGFAGGRLWYTTGTGQDGTLTSVTVDSLHTVHTTSIGEYHTMFASSPGAAPNLLVMANRGLSPATVTVLDVSAADPVVVASLWNPGSCHNAADLALSADATTVYLACGTPYTVESFAQSDLSTVTGAYPTGGHPNAIALSADGGKVAAGAAAVDDTDVGVFQIGDDDGALTDFGGTDNTTLVARGLAFTADGSHVLAITKDSSATTVSLHVISGRSDPTIPAPSIAVSVGTKTIRHGQSVKVMAKLGSWAVGRTVSIYRQPYGGIRVLLGTGTVGAGGTWSITAKPGVRTTYTAQFDGDASYLPATSGGQTVQVHAMVGLSQAGFYRTSGAYRLYHYRAGCWTAAKYCPHFTARVTPAASGSPVRFIVQQRTYSGAWRTLTSGSIGQGSTGYAYAYWRYRGTAWIGHLLRVRATWAGNAANLAGGSGYAYFRITR